jgi:hypothetical protein
MQSLQRAIVFVQRNGDPVELARLNVLLGGQPAPGEALEEFLASQRGDGGWSPFWAQDYTSLDATCVHLAQAQQLVVDANPPGFENGLRFLASRQQANGAWEEDPSVAEMAPPWARPGETAAALYLTANCGFWLASSPVYHRAALKGAYYLAAYLDESGNVPSFLHTHWLCGGLWRRLDMADEAKRVLERLETRIEELSPNHLAWMISALLIAGLPAGHPLIQAALPRLVSGQQKDGRWASDDGPAFDVHTTLEALYALKSCGAIAQESGSRAR